MLDKMNKEIDAVVIGTPDHTHAVIAMAAMQHHKHVYREKPLTTPLGGPRADEGCRELQSGHAAWQPGTLVCLHPPHLRVGRAGAIGQVHTVHAGCDAFKNVYCQLRNLDKLNQHYDVPQGLDYDLWIGPVPFRPYAPFWAPWNWRGWMPLSRAASVTGSVT